MEFMVIVWNAICDEISEDNVSSNIIIELKPVII